MNRNLVNLLLTSLFLAASTASAIPCVDSVKKVSGLEQAQILGLKYVPSDELKAQSVVRYSEEIPGSKPKKYILTYFDPQGHQITDPLLISEYGSVKIPPAYKKAWISTDPQNHLQALALDGKEGLQYYYHPAWTSARSAGKFDRSLYFGRAMPLIRAALDRDLNLPGYPKDKVVAAVVRIMADKLIRVGNEKYLEKNGSSGLTTMLKKDVTVEGQTVHFTFLGKSSKEHDILYQNQQVVDLVDGLRDIPGDHIFQYLDDDGLWYNVNSNDVNKYIGQAAQGPFTAKDFRTWAGSLFALKFLKEAGPTDSAEDARLKISIRWSPRPI